MLQPMMGAAGLEREWRDFVQAKQDRPGLCESQSTATLLQQRCSGVSTLPALALVGISALGSADVAAF
jgi:hypothetical protein